MRVLEVGMIIIGMPLSIEHSHVRLCGEPGSTQINTSRRRWYRSTQRLRLVSSSSPRASSSSGRSAPCLRQAPVPRPCLPSRMGSELNNANTKLNASNNHTGSNACSFVSPCGVLGFKADAFLNDNDYDIIMRFLVMANMEAIRI